MTLYRVTHETVYDYGDVVSVSHSLAHLLPRELAGQVLRDSQLRIEPTPATVSSFSDYFGNPSVFFMIEEPHARLVVQVDSRIAIAAPPERDLAASTPWEETVAAVRDHRDPVTLEAFEWCFDSPLVARSPALRAFAEPSFAPGRPVLEAAHDLCRRIHREFSYDPEATTVATPLEQVLAGRHGVCQDYAHVMIGALRSLGLPARYVSGYLRSRPPDAKRGGATELVGAEASHAWASVFSPSHGWVDFDPTNDMIPGDRHATLGWGRDYEDVSPLQGVTLGGGLQTVSVAVEMRPPDEFATAP